MTATEVPNGETPEEESPTPEQQVGVNKTGRTPEEEVAHWKAMARQNEDKAKANKKAADELAALKQAQMTETERAAEAAKATAAELERVRNENIRYKAAALHGISEENFDLLGTGTEEEILTRAERIGEMEDAVTELERLREQLGMQQQAAQTPGPVPNLRPGTTPVPDDSYPVGWFPQLRPRETTTNT